MDRVLVGMGVDCTTRTRTRTPTTSNHKLRSLVTTTVAKSRETCASTRLPTGTAWTSYHVCWRKHDAESIKQYKAALGAKRWEKQKQWWNRRKTRGGRRPSTPTADDTDEAEVGTDKAKINKGSEHKGAKEGGVYMLYGGSARGQGEAHLTLTARAAHARMTQAPARFEQVCGAIGRAAVKLAENVDAHIEFELTRRCGGIYKDMPSEQSIEQPSEQPSKQSIEQSTEQPTDMPIMPTEQPMDMPIMPTEQPKDMPIEQTNEWPTNMPTKQPTDMPTGQPMEQPTDKPTDKLKEQSIDIDYGKVKPNMSEMATLEGAHLVFKDITLKSGYMQSKRTSVATSRWRHTRVSFGLMRTHLSMHMTRTAGCGVLTT